MKNIVYGKIDGSFVDSQPTSFIPYPCILFFLNYHIDINRIWWHSYALNLILKKYEWNIKFREVSPQHYELFYQCHFRWNVKKNTMSLIVQSLDINAFTSYLIFSFMFFLRSNTNTKQCIILNTLVLIELNN